MTRVMLCAAALLLAAACSREPTAAEMAAVKTDFEKRALPLVAARVRTAETVRIELVLDASGQVTQFLLRLPKLGKAEQQALGDEIAAVGLRVANWPGERVYLKFTPEEVQRARPAPPTAAPKSAP
jgi:hypothetical protein